MTDGFVPPLAENEAGLPGPSIGESIPHEPLIGRGRRRPFRAFNNREFRLLFTAYAIGDIGFWISWISLQSEMARITHTSSLWLGVLFFSTFIPMLLFAPIAGVIADRIDRKLMLIITRGAIGVLAASLGIMVFVHLESPGVLVAFGFAMGTMFAFMAPAQQAATANSVPPSDLTSAISIQSAGNNLARIGGPALAVPILVVWGAEWAFVIYAISNWAVLLTLLPIRLTSQLSTSESGSTWNRWKQGLIYARSRPPAVAALALMGIFSIFGAAHVVLLPVFATDVLGHPRADFTALVITSGVGAVVGALATGFRRTDPTLGTASAWVAGFGATGIAFAFSTTWNLSLLLIAIMGFCYFSVTTSLNTLLQHLSDDEKRGRIMGLFVVAWGGLIPFGGIWMGAVANAAGAPLALGIGAGICLLGAIFFLIRDKKSTYGFAPLTEPPK